MPVNGKTAIAFLIGHPVTHVKTPAAFNALADNRGLDAVMSPLDVAPEHLQGVLTQLRHIRNVTGAVVTIPHKVSAADHCDELTPRARQCGAVNVVTRDATGRLVGDMLDGLGFVEGLQREGVALEGTRVLLLGAGGAASAIGFALSAAGVAAIGIHNRTPSRAAGLADRICRAFPETRATIAEADPRGYDILVNATSLGMRSGDASPVDPAWLTHSMVVAEAIMQPERTPLLEAAERAGARVHVGRAMLEGQLDRIVDLLGAASHPGFENEQ